MHSYFRFIQYVVLIVLCLNNAVASTDVTNADITAPSEDKINIGKGILYLEDPHSHLNLNDVIANTDWKINQDNVFNTGFNHSSWWIKFNIHNEQEQNEWLLEIAYPALDYLDAYIVSSTSETTIDNTVSSHYSMGDKLLFWTRPIKHRNFVIPLDIAQNQSITVYLKTQSNGSIQAPIILWNKTAFHNNDIGITVIHGLYYGGLLIIALYNLLIYAVLGERTYLYYVAYITGMFLFMASLHGWTYMFLWPNATHWNDQAIVFFLSFALAFGYQFTRRFLFNQMAYPIGYTILHYTALTICCTFMVLAFVAPYSFNIQILVPFSAMSCIFGLIAGIAAWVDRRPSAPYYTMAWAILFTGGVVMSLNVTHVIPSNVFTDHALQFGSLLEALMLSFAMAERINHERTMRIQAQSIALDVQQQANEALEKRVFERTEALEQLNKQLRELSDTDQLTELKNRRFLNQYMEDEFIRSARYKHHITIMMIDIDHFKSVNDNYGHLAGDECLRTIAIQLKEAVRAQTDIPSRYGGEEFCIIMPETDQKGAAIVAERIRNSVENTAIQCHNHKLNVTCSIGIFSGIPNNTRDITPFIDKADDALYQSKQNGRNLVTVFENKRTPGDINSMNE